MNRVLSILCVVVILIGGGYWYHRVHSKCQMPLTYTIGSLDARFELTDEEVRAIVSEVESKWEDKTGQNLFTYDPEHASLTINFIFDDRQLLTDDEHTLREVLDRKESISGAIRDEYENLISQYQKLQERYKSQVAGYENRLGVHNGEVAYWNNEGGAPSDIYARLNKEEKRLAGERTALEELADEINELVDQINTLSETGNETVEEYNDQVQLYNDRFNHEQEFTQGDYQKDRINIYQFADLDELKLVLAHEFGHALSLDHVDDEQAVMYYLMDGQDSSLVFTDADLAEFERVCGAR